MGSPFDAAASRLYAEEGRPRQGGAAPAAAARALPAAGDCVAVAGLVKGVAGEVVCEVRAVRRAKDKGEARAARGDRVYELAVAGGGIRKTRLLHLEWRVVRRAAAAGAARRDGRGEGKRRASEDVGREAGAFLEAMRGGGRVVAPMVGGSELAFRLLCRRYGATVAYTPMLEASRFVGDAGYRRAFFQTHAGDRPLVAHFCGNDPDVVGEACAVAAATGGVDAVDLNLGCPQRVAFAGHYGSYLMGPEDRSLVCAIVAAMRRRVPATVAVCAKIRLMDSAAETLQLVTDLRDAGAQVVAIHGRRRATWHREGPGARDGPADLGAIRAVVDAVGDSVVVVTNGNVRDARDVPANLAATGAASIMVAEALLDDPALFAAGASAPQNTPPGDAEDLRRVGLALEYLDLVDRHGNPAGYRSVAFHCRRIAKDVLVKYDALDDLLDGPDAAAARAVLDRCAAYARGEASYAADAEKKRVAVARQAARDAMRARRKRWEERVIRKAKREGKPLDFYVKKGADKPTKADLDALRAMKDEADRLEAWNAKHSQHCARFHLDAAGCPRGDSCAFLHDRIDDEDAAYG